MSDLISRQAAIEALHDEIVRRRIDEDTNDDGALDEFDTEAILRRLPSAQSETHEKRTETHACDYACDCISRQDAIRWVKTECNPYGKPTLDFESGKWVIEHLKQMPSVQPVDKDINVSCKDAINRQDAIDAVDKLSDKPIGYLESAIDVLVDLPSVQPDIIYCKDCKHWREGTAFSYCDKLHGMGVLDALDYMTAEDDYCSMAEREDDEN